MLEDLFCKSFFTIKCILENKIEAIILVNTCATRFGYIDVKLTKIIYRKLEI